MILQARDKRALIGGAVVVTGLLAYLLWPRGTVDSRVELVPADQRQGSAAPVAPAPVTAPPVQPMPVQPAVVAVAIPEGLKLTGVTGRSAIFSLPDGSQRLIQSGREVAPGIVLQAVRVRDVILAVGPATYRVSLGGSAVAVQPTPVQPVPVVVVPAAPAVVAAPAPAPATVPNANLMR